MNLFAPWQKVRGLSILLSKMCTGKTIEGNSGKIELMTALIDRLEVDIGIARESLSSKIKRV